MRQLIDEMRLLMSEALIRYAVRVAPKHHPDSLVIFQAALMVAKRPVQK